MRKRSLDQRLRIHLVYDESVASLPSHEQNLVKVGIQGILIFYYRL